MKQLIGCVRVFVLEWEKDENKYGHGGKMTHLVGVPLTSERYPCVYCKESRKFIFDKLETV